jgi:hypothetical protein
MKMVHGRMYVRDEADGEWKELGPATVEVAAGRGNEEDLPPVSVRLPESVSFEVEMSENVSFGTLAATLELPVRYFAAALGMPVCRVCGQPASHIFGYDNHTEFMCDRHADRAWEIIREHRRWLVGRFLEEVLRSVT